MPINSVHSCKCLSTHLSCHRGAGFDIRMMTELTITAVLTGLGLTLVPAAVFLWSKDDERRRRAWRLLSLLRRR